MGGSRNEIAAVLSKISRFMFFVASDMYRPQTSIDMYDKVMKMGRTTPSQVSFRCSVGVGSL